MEDRERHVVRISWRRPLRSLAEQVHSLSLRVIPWAAGSSVLFLLASFAAALVGGRQPGRWVALPGFWAICAVLVAAGIASFAKAVLDGNDDNATLGRRIAIPVLHVV